ncbi:MAG: family transporter [Candidatus Saccharibacteria bacterium]|nr:family transporter [Candidatus Saccharibacteria bacterium]
MFGFESRKKDKAIRITVANTTILRVLALIFLSLLLVTLFRRASHALTLIFIAFFLSLVLNAPVHWLSQRLPSKGRGNRTLATSISFLVVVILLAAFIGSLVPPLVRQTSNFIDQAPQLVSDVHNEDTSLGKFVRRYHLESQSDKLASQLSDRLQNFSGSAFTTVTRITSSVFSVLTVLVLTFMMLIEGPHWLVFIQRLLPDEKEAWVKHISLDMYRVLKGYVNGQVFLAALAACLIVVPLFILHVSYPVALMVIIFICGLIPLVGHTIGAIIVSTVALFHSPVTALIVLAYYIFYQQVENYVVQPRIQANSTDMSPLLVFSSVIIGVSFNGLLGGLVAIPIAGCLRILALDYLERKKLLEPLPVISES